MGNLKIVLVKKKLIYLIALIMVNIIITSTILIYLSTLPANIFIDPKNGIIVIDPGHGGIDGGTNKDGILEKEINLDIGIKLKYLLEQKGYTVVMTREKDVSLEELSNASNSRHQRDLNARTNIINNSNAQLFLSIHVNCNMKKPETDGSIVLYNNKFDQSKILAYCIQRTLNAIELNGIKRTIHDPVQAKFFVLGYSKIPGVIIETAFISNKEERQELTKEGFRSKIAEAIALGTDQYLNEQNKTLTAVK